MKKAAKAFANSFIFRNARNLWKKNQLNASMALTKAQKLFVGIFLILSDYGENKFPPRFEDRISVYAGEIDLKDSVVGVSREEITNNSMRRPFWLGPLLYKYLEDFMTLTRIFERHKILPPQKILELGCGTGWMAEFLAATGYSIVASSIAPQDIQDAKLRIDALKAKNIEVDLRFITSPYGERRRSSRQFCAV